MEEKKNEEVKEIKVAIANDEQAIVKKNNKTMISIVLIAVLLIIAAGVACYFLFFKDNSSDKKVNYSGVFTSSDGKKITLKYTGSEYFNDGNKNGFELEGDGKKLIMYSPDMNDHEYETENLFTVFDNLENWYLLNDSKKEIVANYHSKNGIYVYRESKEGQPPFYFVYDGEGEDVKLHQIINGKTSNIISKNLDLSNYKSYFIHNNLFLIFNSQILVYDFDGKLISTTKCDKVYDRSSSSDEEVLYMENGKLILWNMFDDRKNEFKNVNTYSNDKYKLVEYKYNENYYVYYDNKLYSLSENPEDENYKVYSFGNGQCPEYNFLVNKKTNKIEKYSSEGLGFYKTKSGYYFTKDNNSECSLDWTTDVYTSKWKYIGELGIDDTMEDSVDKDGNISFNEDGKSVKYNINGEKINDNNNSVATQDVYKTTDGKFTLKIIDKNNTEVSMKARQEFYNNEKDLVKYNCESNEEFEGIKCNNIDDGFDAYFEDYYNSIKEDIKAYAYLNEKLIYINRFSEDENYGSYDGYFVNSEDAGHSGSLWNRFVVDKNTKLIWESPEFQFNDNWGEGIFDRFRGMSLYFFKTDAGYYFAEEIEPGYTIYTKNGKKIGYVVDYNNIKSDKNGIYVYDNFDSKKPIKYDAKGNKID